MAVLIAEYRVLDLETFRRVLAEFADVRKEVGASGHRLMAPTNNPSSVTAVIDFASAVDAELFSREPRRLEALQRAGVIERTDTVLEDVETQVY